jgi:hypothetical protein
VIGRLGALVGWTLAAWAVAVYPAHLLWGRGDLALWEDPILFRSLAAAALCLVPTGLTLAWASWAARQAGEQQLMMTLGGTGLRMGFVLAGGLLLFFRVPYFHEPGFWGWILAFYLFTLALEMTLILTGRAPAGGSPGSANS